MIARVQEEPHKPVLQRFQHILHETLMRQTKFVQGRKRVMKEIGTPFCLAYRGRQGGRCVITPGMYNGRPRVVISATTHGCFQNNVTLKRYRHNLSFSVHVQLQEQPNCKRKKRSLIQETRRKLDNERKKKKENTPKRNIRKWKEKKEKKEGRA